MIEEPTMRTSAEWNRDDNVEILDPDGWDRKNYYYSWNTELIDIVEYRKRVIRSTCLWRNELNG